MIRVRNIRTGVIVAANAQMLRRAKQVDYLEVLDHDNRIVKRDDIGDVDLYGRNSKPEGEEPPKAEQETTEDAPPPPPPPPPADPANRVGELMNMVEEADKAEDPSARYKEIALEEFGVTIDKRLGADKSRAKLIALIEDA